MSKQKLSVLIFSLLSLILGISVRPMTDALRSLACNLECKAQLLYKNTAFFDVVGAITAIKKDPTAKVVFDQSRFTSAYLGESGIELLVVMSSGEFIVTSRVEKLAMLARPTFEGNRLIWRCQFFSENPKSLSERACSY